MLQFLLAPLLAVAMIFQPVNDKEAKVIQKASASVVRITGKTFVEILPGFEMQVGYTCSGFAIEPERVMTDEHCLGDDMLVDGLPVIVLKYDKYHDLALLEVPGLRRPVLKFRDKGLRMFESVNGIGFGYSFTELTVTFNRVVLLAFTPDLEEMPPGVWYAGPFIGGMSGGPVIDKDGKVVGIVQRRTTDSSMGYGADVATIKAFLN